MSKLNQIRLISFIYVLLLILVNGKTVLGQSDCAQIVWSDEFEYSGSPDPLLWDYDLGGGGWGNNEVQTYTSNSANSFVENGILTIHAIKSGSTWTSARMVTRNKGDWLYGRIEIRAKLPVGVGTWPAIWMLPTDWEYGGWPASGEIDIMEHVGSDQNRVHGTIHTESYNHMLGTQKGESILVANASTSFHVYAIEWTESEIKWFVDDTQYFTFPNENSGYQTWPFDKRFHLLLNIAMGGNWGGDIDPNLTEASMEIDYVRIYNEAPPAIAVSGPEYVTYNDTATFSATYYPDYSYSWSIPEDATLLSGDASNECTILWGEQDGNVISNITTPCATYSSNPYFVRAIFVPDGDELILPNKVLLDSILWKVDQTPGNTINLSLDGDNLVVDFNITDRYQNPNIFLELDQITDLTVLPKMYVTLMAEQDMGPANFRFDLIDTQGEVDLNDLFKVDNLIEDGQYHDYLYLFAAGGKEDYKLEQIEELRLYFNYSFAGAETSGRFYLKPVKMVKPDFTLGIKDFSDLAVKVYPNPVKDRLIMDFDNSALLNLKISLFNLAGQQISPGLITNRNNMISLDISNVSPGLYILQIIAEDQKYTGTIVKE